MRKRQRRRQGECAVQKKLQIRPRIQGVVGPLMVLSVTELWKLVNTVKCCIFCILILQLSKRRNFAAFQFCIFPVLYIQLLLVFTRPLMGKVNFHGYLISRFYPTHDICGNFMHTKIHVLQYLLKFGSSASRQLNISPFRSFSSHHCTIICHLIFSTHSPRRQTTLLITIHQNNNNFYKKTDSHASAALEEFGRHTS